MKSWPVQDAKSRFGEMLAACEREGPQVVTEHGVEAAVLVTFGEWRRLNPVAALDLKELLLSDEARYEDLVPARRGATRHREPLEFWECFSSTRTSSPSFGAHGHTAPSSHG